jgi:hypothetical protein
MYTPLTLLSQRKLALTGISTLVALEIIGAPKKFENWPRPLFRPSTDHAHPQKLNPLREKVPLICRFNTLIFPIFLFRTLCESFFSALTFYWFCTNVVSCTQASLLRSVTGGCISYCILSVLPSFRGSLWRGQIRSILDCSEMEYRIRPQTKLCIHFKKSVKMR